MQVFPEERFRLGGDPTAIGASADIWARFAGEADSTAADLRALDADDFQGDEADTYRDRLNTDLPPCLDSTSQAWTAVGGALRSYATILADLQTRMSGLRSTGYAQWQAATAAQQQASAAAQTDAAHAADRQTAADALKPGQKLPADTYQPAAAGARSTATSTTATYTATVSAVDQLRAQHCQAVNACADAIDRATAMRFADPPSWLGHLWEKACDWVADHIDILQTLSAVLKQISSIAGTLAMIPILAPIAGPVALGAGMLATGIDAGIKITTGQGDWTEIGIGALGFVPGARAAMVATAAETSRDALQGNLDFASLAATAAFGGVGRRPRGSRSEPNATPTSHQTTGLPTVPIQPPRVAVIHDGKLDFMFGKAAPHPHNTPRSSQNRAELARIGIHDTTEGRSILREHLDGVVRSDSNIRNHHTDQYGVSEVRESLLAGPGGFVKLTSTWLVAGESRRLTTIIPIGGKL